MWFELKDLCFQNNNSGEVAEQFNKAILESQMAESPNRRGKTKFYRRFSPKLLCTHLGEVAERFNAAVLKTVEGATPP